MEVSLKQSREGLGQSCHGDREEDRLEGGMLAGGGMLLVLGHVFVSSLISRVNIFARGTMFTLVYFPWVSLSENSKPVMHKELRERDIGRVSFDHQNRSQGLHAALWCVEQADGAGLCILPACCGAAGLLLFH